MSKVRSAAVRTAAKKRGRNKAIRDAIQALVAVVAAGGTTAIVDLLLGRINNVAIGAVLTIIYKILVTYAQNYLESIGRIPPILPTPPVVTGEVVGEVTDAAGEVIGEVTGTVGGVVTDVTEDVTNVVSDITDPVEDTLGEITDLLGDPKRPTGDLQSDLSDDS